MYESQLALQTIKESTNPFSVELYLLTNFLTYMSLWKIGRKQESCKYLEIVKINIVSIRKGIVLSKFPLVSIENFYGILSYSLALMKIEVEGNYKSAMAICEDSISCLGDEIMSRGLVRSILTKIKNIEKIPYGTVAAGLSDEFEKIFFISLFLPLMSPKIPDIKVQSTLNNFKISRKSSNGSKRTSSRSSNHQDTYKIRGKTIPLSPSVRPKSGYKTEQYPFNVTRPRSSNGYLMEKRINKIYLS